MWSFQNYEGSQVFNTALTCFDGSISTPYKGLLILITAQGLKTKRSSHEDL